MRDGNLYGPPCVPPGLFQSQAIGSSLAECFAPRVPPGLFPKSCCNLTEDLAPRIPPGLFQSQTAGSSFLRNPAVKQAERYVRLLTHLPHIFRIPVGLLPPDAVMDVHHM